VFSGTPGKKGDRLRCPFPNFRKGRKVTEPPKLLQPVEGETEAIYENVARLKREFEYLYHQ